MFSLFNNFPAYLVMSVMRVVFIGMVETAIFVHDGVLSSPATIKDHNMIGYYTKWLVK